MDIQGLEALTRELGFVVSIPALANIERGNSSITANITQFVFNLRDILPARC